MDSPNCPSENTFGTTDAQPSPFETIEVGTLFELLRNVRLAKTFSEKLDLFCKGISLCGWRRVHLYIVDPHNNELVSASSHGLTPDQMEYLRNNGLKITDLKRLFNPQLQKYRVGRAYYFPHDSNDPFVQGLDSISIESGYSVEDFEGWHPSDILFFPLIGFGGNTVGLLSMDDPVSGKKPTEDDLKPIELFADAAIGLIAEGEFEAYFDKTHSLLSRLFDLSPVMIFLSDEDYKIIDANEAALKNLGFSREELIGYNECRLIASMDSYKRLLKERGLGSFSGEVQITGKKKDFWGLLFSVPVFSSRSKIIGYITHVIDITESKKLHQYLIRAEKLAGIGVLAGGLAHEINNPLQAILSRAEQISTEDELSDEARKNIAEIIEFTKETGQILKDLAGYTYSAKRETPFAVNLNEVIEKAVKLIGRSMDTSGIKFKLEFGDIPLIKATESELMQVFVNLISNSVDALSGMKGHVKVVTFDEEGDVFCIIEDNGKGIESERLDNIFEPFYTTKEVGKGTGLGLFACYKIVAKNNGLIEIESELGKGTKVFLKFHGEV
ncbi:MAG TPA: PAS domain S-box protein [candidate division Zixibacteria bacterium]|nr:PAS domain S-box protein [candidate division Zixibacteria bacterium]